jgi:hypothetical protein
VTLVGKVVAASEQAGGNIDLQVSDGTGTIDVRAYVEGNDVSAFHPSGGPRVGALKGWGCSGACSGKEGWQALYGGGLIWAPTRTLPSTGSCGPAATQAFTSNQPPP